MITLTNRQLQTALRPVLPLTGTDYDLPLLTCVHLHVRNGYLYTSATDRFRAGIKRTKLLEEFPQADVFDVLVRFSDLSRILTLFKPTRAPAEKQPKLRLYVEDSTFYAEAIRGTSYDDKHDFDTLRIGVPTHDGQFPDIFQLVLQALTTEERAVDSQGFNAEFLASFREAARYELGPNCALMAIRLGTAASKPAAVQIGDDFVGLLMPRRHNDGSRAISVGTWKDELRALSTHVTTRKAVTR